jgi:hypothetical protein
MAESQLLKPPYFDRLGVATFNATRKLLAKSAAGPGLL